MISPKIIKIRKELDKIDSTLLLVIKKRTILVDKIVKLKKSKNEIVDKKRINFILKKNKRKISKT